MDKSLRDTAGDEAAVALAAARAEPLWPRSPRWMVLVGIAGAAFLLTFPWLFTDRFSQHLMIMVLLYALMAQSWNVMAGLSGQISLGHAIFFGIGAYACAVLYTKWGVTPWLGL